MNIGIGQILITLFVLLLLFGNLPKVIREILSSIKEFQKSISPKEQNKIEDTDSKNDSNIPKQ
jgi:Sec-independent protein translocase protein TatA